MNKTNSLLAWAQDRKNKFHLDAHDLDMLMEWEANGEQMPFIYEDEICMPIDYIPSQQLTHAIWWWLQEQELGKPLGEHRSDNNNFTAQQTP